MCSINKGDISTSADFVLLPLNENKTCASVDSIFVKVEPIAEEQGRLTAAVLSYHGFTKCEEANSEQGET